MGRHAGDAQLFPLGSTWYGGDLNRIPSGNAGDEYGNLDIEGAERTFRREEAPNASAAIPGGGDLIAKCVRNVHSTVLAKSTIVKYNPANEDGYDRQVVPCDADEGAAGVVDPYLHQDVQVGDLFWIISEGRVPVLFGATATGAPGTKVSAAAGGLAKTGAATAVDDSIGVVATTGITVSVLNDVLLDIRYS